MARGSGGRPGGRGVRQTRRPPAADPAHATTGERPQPDPARRRGRAPLRGPARDDRRQRNRPAPGRDPTRRQGRRLCEDRGLRAQAGPAGRDPARAVAAPGAGYAPARHARGAGGEAQVLAHSVAQPGGPGTARGAGRPDRSCFGRRSRTGLEPARADAVAAAPSRCCAEPGTGGRQPSAYRRVPAAHRRTPALAGSDVGHAVARSDPRRAGPQS